jgi:hypothetical protein
VGKNKLKIYGKTYEEGILYSNQMSKMMICEEKCPDQNEE